MNPINNILKSKGSYAHWTDPELQSSVRKEVLALEIPGLIDLQFTEEASAIRVTPVFNSEKDWMWYNLKYGNTL